MPPVVTIYLIHAEPRYGHAGHYLGVTKRPTLVPRMEEHLNGKSRVTLVRLFAEAVGASDAEDAIKKLVVATWQGTRGEERRLKNRGGLRRICPVCRAASGQKPYQPRRRKV